MVFGFSTHALYTGACVVALSCCIVKSQARVLGDTISPLDEGSFGSCFICATGVYCFKYHLSTTTQKNASFIALNRGLFLCPQVWAGW